MSTLVKSTTPAETLETLLKLVRHSEMAFKVRAVKGSHAVERLEVEFENGVRYDLCGGVYTGSIELFGPEPRKVFIAELVIADTVLATRVFETEELREAFLNAAGDYKKDIRTREEDVK